MNFYAVLGIPRDADDETIRSAYRILVRRYHPDRGTGSSAEKFRQVREAYQTLIDPASRQSYDVSLQWAGTRVPVRVEPMAPQSQVFRQEDPRLFGAFSGVRPRRAFAGPVDIDELFERWRQSLEEWFFDDGWLR